MPTPTPPTTATTGPTRGADALANVYSTVVHIIVTRLSFHFDVPYSVYEQPSATGTGFFIDGDGYILTCAHVIRDAHEVFVEIADTGRKRYSATVLGMCPEFDLGMIRIEGYTNARWCTLDRENTTNVVAGDTTTVVGYPIDNNLKFTKGIISGQQRNRYQTDAAVNSGNSGGPMFKNGQVVGVVDSGYVNTQNIGFAIPIQRYFLVAPLLRRPRHIVHFPKTFGFTFHNTYPEWAQFTGHRCDEVAVRRRSRRRVSSRRSSTSGRSARRRSAPTAHTRTGGCGVHVTKVFRDGLVATTGLRKGDVVCKLDGIAVDSYGEISRKWMNQSMTVDNLLCTLPLGKTVEIEYWSTAKRRLVHARFRMRERPLAVRVRYPRFERVDYTVMGGMVVMPLTVNHATDIFKRTPPRLRKYLLDENCHQPRVVLASVLTGSFLSTLQVFDEGPYVLAEVNGREVRTLADFHEAMKTPVVRNGREWVVLLTEDEVKVVLPLNVLRREEGKLKRVHQYGGRAAGVVPPGSLFSHAHNGSIEAGGFVERS